MTQKKLVLSSGLLAFMALGLAGAEAKGPKQSAAPQAQLSETGKQLEAKYAAMLAALKADISKDLPVISAQKLAALQKAHADAEALQAKANSAQSSAGEAGGIKAKIANWKQFWIKKADNGIKKAQADLKAATTDAQRAAANKDLAKWQQNKADGEKEIQGAEAELQKASASQAGLAKAKDAAQDKLTKARGLENSAAKDLLASLDTLLSSDKLDAKLTKATVLTAATPNSRPPSPKGARRKRC